MEPWGTPVLTFFHVENCPLRTTRHFLCVLFLFDVFVYVWKIKKPVFKVNFGLKNRKKYLK